MNFRLSASDASFYRMEATATPMYTQSLLILAKPRDGVSYEHLLSVVERRLSQVPRYRQKIRDVAMRLARPVWIDDRGFDITHHVQHHALPSPGSDEQLHILISRLAGQGMDPSRPLWEIDLIEGLSGNRIALYLKSHQALVNGMSAPAILHVLVDRSRRPPEFTEDIWVPGREPGTADLVLGAIGDWLAAPVAQLRGVASMFPVLTGGADPLTQITRRASELVMTLTRGATPSSPLNAEVSHNRLFTVAHGRLDDYREVRTRYDCTVNDVVLAVITGALRNFLLSRGEDVATGRTMRAMAPLPVSADRQDLESGGQGQVIGAVAPFLVDLPVGEPNPMVRLSQITYATETYPVAANLVDARTIVSMSGFAPPTLHAMGVRVATSYAGFSQRVFNLLITNSPGPQRQLYVCGARLLEAYNVPPLLPNRALAIGVTSYHGMLYYGVNADRKVVSDVRVVPALLDESLNELLEAAR